MFVIGVPTTLALAKKMKLILLLLSFLLVSVTVFSQPKEDPFSSNKESHWHFEVLKEKPYVLEIACGEYEGRHPDESSKLKIEVTPEFIDSSRMLSIAISASEVGEIIERGKHTVRYLVSKNSSGTFDLKAHIKTLEGGLSTINTEITLKESEWIVIGGLSRQAEDGKSVAFLTAIRISGRANKSE